MTPFPRGDYAALAKYDPGRAPVEVDLSDNTNLWGPHPAALAVLRGAGPDQVRSYPEVYADTLVAAIADRFGVPAECVTTGAGSDDVLDSAFRASAGPGEAVAHPVPTFSVIGDLARMNGMEARPVEWADAMSDPSSLLRPGTAVVYLCSPNNPTGAVVPREWTERFLALRGDDGPLVVLDEAYADFGGESLVRLAAETPKLLVTRTCSKAVGLAGLRCGFGIARSDVALEVEKARGPYKVARLTAEAAAAALRDQDGYTRRTVAECLENRARLLIQLEARGLEFLPSEANFVLVRAPSGSGKEDAAALRADGVQVRPFTGVPGFSEGLRVTVGPWPLMERFLSAMDRRVAALTEVTSA